MKRRSGPPTVTSPLPIIPPCRANAFFTDARECGEVPSLSAALVPRATGDDVHD